MAFLSSLFKVFEVKHRKPTLGFYFNLLLSIAFVLFRKLPPVCKYFQAADGVCKFTYKETEVFVFLLVVITLKNQHAISFEQVVLNTLMFTKLATCVMFYWVDYRFVFVYSLLCLFRLWLFYDDFVEASENTTYFNHVSLEEQLKEKPYETLVVLFYTTWSPKCQAIFPVFAQLSENYSTVNVRFGKVDIGKYPEAGIKHGVNPKSTSAQLPTIIVYENGKADNWRPCIGNDKKLKKYVFSEENIIRDFQLNRLRHDSHEKTKSTKLKKEE